MKKLWKRAISLLVVTVMLVGVFGIQAMADEVEMVEALLVTEVLDWGETITEVRIEYPEEISSRAISNSVEHMNMITYKMVTGREIVYIYVNNSGIPGDVQFTGKYVFLKLANVSEDFTTYRDQVMFDVGPRTRHTHVPYYVYQTAPITTIAGNTIPYGVFTTSGELRPEVDRFTTFTYTNEENDSWLNYNLFIPEGYEEKDEDLEDLPIIVHFPSGDYAYEDDDGRYRGPLYTHPDCTEWATPESQAVNKSFVITVGGLRDSTWSANFEESVMQQNYFTILNQLVEEYNIDPARIYGFGFAGGTPAMLKMHTANPGLFAAQIIVAYEPYHVYADEELAHEMTAPMLETTPTWIFAGLTDDSGHGVLGADDTRMKGDRLIDYANTMTELGYAFDVAYGENGELMWNGMLRGRDAEALAQAQLDRAEEAGAKNLATIFIPNTIPQTMHWSWNAAVTNALVRNWIFQNVNENPALGE